MPNIKIIDLPDYDKTDVENFGNRRFYKKQVFPICEGMEFEYWDKNEWHFHLLGQNKAENERLQMLAIMLTEQFYNGIPKKNLLMVIAYFRQVCNKAA